MLSGLPFPNLLKGYGAFITVVALVGPTAIGEVAARLGNTDPDLTATSL